MNVVCLVCVFFFSSRRRHTRWPRDWSSDVCSSDLLSGSGKSSVVFDTLAKESRRQMTLNYPAYIRNQMPRYERPIADQMQNLSPVVVVEQRQIIGNSRSTVGTYMDINPLIRLLFSRIAEPSIGSPTELSNHR